MQEGVTPRKRHRTVYMRGYRQRRAASRAEAKGELLKFQQEFVDVVESAAVDIAVLSCPRAQGKSWLAGRLIARSLTPGDVLHEEHVENILVSASRSQARLFWSLRGRRCPMTLAFAGELMVLNI